MRASTRFAAPVALLLLVAACGRTTTPMMTPTTANPPRPKVSSPTTAAAIPMVRETGTPYRPPTVTLTTRSDAGTVRHRGVLYTADFINRRAVVEAYSKTPIPWPASSVLDPASTPVLEFETPIAPDYVLVVSYAHLKPTFLIPVGYVKQIICQRFVAPHCRFATTASGVRLLGLARSTFTAGYVSVFASWHVPMSERRAGPTASSVDSACWLFRFDPEVAVGASQS